MSTLIPPPLSIQPLEGFVKLSKRFCVCRTLIRIIVFVKYFIPQSNIRTVKNTFSKNSGLRSINGPKQINHALVPKNLAVW